MVTATDLHIRYSLRSIIPQGAETKEETCASEEWKEIARLPPPSLPLKSLPIGYNIHISGLFQMTHFWYGCDNRLHSCRGIVTLLFTNSRINDVKYAVYRQRCLSDIRRQDNLPKMKIITWPISHRQNALQDETLKTLALVVHQIVFNLVALVRLQMQKISLSLWQPCWKFTDYGRRMDWLLICTIRSLLSLVKNTKEVKLNTK